MAHAWKACVRKDSWVRIPPPPPRFLVVVKYNMNSDKEYMSLAIKQAKLAKNLGDLPFGAIIVCNGQVISEGNAKMGLLETLLTMLK